jgi:hypothetical protein
MAVCLTISATADSLTVTNSADPADSYLKVQLPATLNVRIIKTNKTA